MMQSFALRLQTQKEESDDADDGGKDIYKSQENGLILRDEEMFQPQDALVSQCFVAVFKEIHMVADDIAEGQADDQQDLISGRKEASADLQRDEVADPGDPDIGADGLESRAEKEQAKYIPDALLPVGEEQGKAQKKGQETSREG